MDYNKTNRFSEMLSNVIKNCVNETISKYKFDESYRGMITADLGDNYYEVEINGKKYKIKCKSRKLTVGEPEWVTVPKGNWNELFIR